MKKIIGITAAVLMIAATFVGCASTKDNANALAGVQQARDNGLPGWASYRITFKSEAAPGYFDGREKYQPEEKGYFAEGEAMASDKRSSQIAARLEARSNLASYVSAEIASYAASNGYSSDQINAEVVDQILVGSRIVDSFYDTRDGTMYILMFISQDDIKKSAETRPTLKNIINAMVADSMSEMDAGSKN